MITSIITSIKNVLRWIPIIWRDRNWDHTFLYIILQFKLSNMEKYLRKYGSSINAEKDADRIKTCVNLLKRLMNDEYHDKVFKKHDEKWGKPEFNWIELKDQPKYKELKIKRLNVITEKDKEQEEKEYDNLIKIGNYSKQQDIDYLFETIRKYHQGWWD